MSKYTNCPECQTKLALPELPARRIQCPRCSHKFDVSAHYSGQVPPSSTQQLKPAEKPKLQSFGDDAPPPGRPSSAGPAQPSRRPANPAPVLDEREAADDSEPAPPPPAFAGAPRGSAQSSGGRGKPGSEKRSMVGPIPIGIGIVALAGCLGALYTFLSNRQAAVDESLRVARPAEEGGKSNVPNGPSQPPGPASSPSPSGVATISNPGLGTPAAPTRPAAGATAPTATASSPGASPPTERSEEAIVNDLKEATVYIKLKVGGKTISTGTGYAIETDPAGTVWIATNRHVATLDPDELPDGLVEKSAKPELEVVFRSGQPGKEQAVAAQLAAADSSEELENDIAFLIVRDVKNPPAPLRLQDLAEPSEGRYYVGGGFPLGGLVSRIVGSHGNPSITVTRGSISAVRRDEFNHLKVIQVDGSLQPGNSGGPIVDSRTGRLLGMAVAKANADTIGFLVPAAHVRDALAGTLGRSYFTVNSVSPGSADLTIQTDLLDPREKVREVRVYVAPVDAVGAFSPNPDGTWNAMPNTQPTNMQMGTTTQNRRAAQGRLQTNLQKDRMVLVQSAHVDEAGRVFYHAPRAIHVPEKPGPILPPNSIQKLVEKLYRKSMAKLGELIDPEKECHLSKDEKTGEIKLSIPPRLHVLAPEVRKEKKPVNNAPMALIDVKGDFAALVKVVGEINPGSEPLALPQGVTYRTANGQTKRKPPGTFQGAGLVVFQDGSNYLRLERTSFTMEGTPELQQKILVEIVRKGEHHVKPIYLPVPEEEMMLVVARRNGRFSCLMIVGNQLSFGTREIPLDFLGDETRVGIIASNVSQKPFEAEFKSFLLLDDKSKIEAALGSGDSD